MSTPGPSVHPFQTLDDTQQEAAPKFIETGNTMPTEAALGRYRVLRPLGAGGMGSVFAAYDMELGREVALKVLRQPNPRAIRAFKAEFRALADVDHPNLVRLYELVHLDERWFFAMELVDGVSVVDYVRPHARVDVPRVRHAFRQLARGVAALHDVGKLHRDVKPSNTVVDHAGRVVLLDFGLVAELGATPGEASDRIVGTVPYIAPENIAARIEHSPASDWYSVGAVLYEALVGRAPFTGNIIDVLDAKQERDPPSPRCVGADVPHDLDELCMALLSRDPAVRPRGHDVLRALGVRRVAPSTTGGLFVGREQHLRALRSAHAVAASGEGTAVLVRGTSGIGKSALCQRFLAEVTAEGTLVLSGRCYERETVPYKGMDGVVEALSQFLQREQAVDALRAVPRDAAPLAQLFPAFRWMASRVETDSDPHHLRSRAFGALRESLMRVATGRPVVIAVDDAQWVDRDSVDLIAELMRGPNAPPVLWVLSYRSDERTEPLTALLDHVERSGGASVPLELDALPSAEAGRLAESLLQRATPQQRGQAQAIGVESGGNPLFVGELARHLSDSSDRDGSVASATPTLDAVVAARIERLRPDARRVLEVSAVAGHPVAARIALDAAGIDTGADAINALRAAHLVRTRAGEWVEPYHDRIREIVVDHLAPQHLDDVHRRLGMALEAAGNADPEVLAAHFAGAGDTDRARRYSIAAADRASDALAFDRAARLYREALRYEPTERVALQTRLGDALANGGRSVEAARVYLEAAAGTDGSRRLELERRAADQLLRSGHVDEGIEAFRSVLAAIGVPLTDSPRAALLKAMARRAVTRARGYGFKRRTMREISPVDRLRVDTLYSVASGLALVAPFTALDLQSRHTAAALALGEPYRVARAIASSAVPIAARGTRGAARTDKVLGIARREARASEHPHAIALVDVTSGFAAYCRGEWTRAIELLTQAEVALRERCVGASWELATTQFYLAMALTRRGAYRDLIQRVHPLVLSAHQRGDLHASANLRLAGCYAHLAMDDAGAALLDIDEAVTQWHGQHNVLQAYRALFMRSQVALYQGRGARAFEAFEARWPSMSRSLIMRIQEVTLSLCYVRACCALEAGATRIATRAARTMERQNAPWGNALALAVRGAVAAARGDRAVAEPLLRSSAEGLDRCDMEASAAAVRVRLAELAGSGRDEALGALSYLGAVNPTRLARLLAPRVG